MNEFVQECWREYGVKIGPPRQHSLSEKQTQNQNPRQIHAKFTPLFTPLFMPLFDVVFSRMPEGTKVEDCLKVMESVAKLGHKQRADKADEEKKLKFGFNKTQETDNEDT